MSWTGIYVTSDKFHPISNKFKIMRKYGNNSPQQQLYFLLDKFIKSSNKDYSVVVSGILTKVS